MGMERQVGEGEDEVCFVRLGFCFWVAAAGGNKVRVYGGCGKYTILFWNRIMHTTILCETRMSDVKKGNVMRGEEWVENPALVPDVC